MNSARLAAFATFLSLLALSASAAPLQPKLSGLAFLLGTWTSGIGHVADSHVADTGGTSKGTSTITAEAGGATLLRRDHVALFDKSGKPSGNFDILMTIYADQGTIHADYFDGTHVIHYISAAMIPGKSVAFATAPSPAAPSFRLIYTLEANKLTVSFAMAPPGQTIFHPIADGILLRGV